METSRPETSRRGYVIALIVFILGAIGSAALVAFFAYGLFTLGDDLQRMVAPGTEQFELFDTGTHTIFYEYRSRVDGIDYESEPTSPRLDISVTRIDDNREINVSPSLMSTSYTLTHHAGHSIRTFPVDEPGTYEITAEYWEGETGSEVVLAVGQGVTRGILTSIGSFFAGGLLFCLITVVAIAIAGFTFYRRYQAERPQAS
jgi:hypothetical protein